MKIIFQTFIFRFNVKFSRLYNFVIHKTVPFTIQLAGKLFSIRLVLYIYHMTLPVPGNQKKINRLWLQSPAHLLANLSLDHHHIASHQPGGVFLLEDWDDASSKSWKFHGLLKLEPYHPFE